MSLAVLEVAADPVLAFPSFGTNGEPRMAHLYAGQCKVGGDPDDHLLAKLARSAAPVRLGFYVPEAGPLPPSYLLSVWAEVSLASARISAGDYARPGPYGVDQAEVQLVDDDRGLGGLWPYLWFTANGGEPMMVRYRLTVTSPVE